MRTDGHFSTQALVFALVASAFTVVYITQPVLPILEEEFAVDARIASLSVSMVIFGIALANLPFGMLVDRYPIKPIILTGGSIVATASLICALTHHFAVLIGARFIQGLFIPSLTTCIAAYLAQSLPAARLNVVMGSYVAATVAGGLGGRLLGGWLHPPLHWRYAFVSAAALVIAATLSTCLWLPRESARQKTEPRQAGFLELLAEPGLLRMLAVAFGAFFVFSSTFNYLPFYLSQPPLSARTEVITLMYLAYLIGIVIGPMSGKLSNRLGSGATMVLGSIIFATAIAASLIQSLAVIAVSLVGVCAGFFAIHAAAVGLLNRRLTSSRGRANSLYVLCYYSGGAAGITACGHAYGAHGWSGAAALNGAILLLPLSIGLLEIVKERRERLKH
jgi:YNFM family putative membrane transporter